MCLSPSYFFQCTVTSPYKNLSPENFLVTVKHILVALANKVSPKGRFVWNYFCPYYFKQPRLFYPTEQALKYSSEPPDERSKCVIYTLHTLSKNGHRQIVVAPAIETRNRCCEQSVFPAQFSMPFRLCPFKRFERLVLLYNWFLFEGIEITVQYLLSFVGPPTGFFILLLTQTLISLFTFKLSQNMQTDR